MKLPPAAFDLDTAITDFGTLAALALALLTVFVTQRGTALVERRTKQGLKVSDYIREATVDSVLTVAAALLTLTILPLALDALGKLGLGHDRGVLHTTFVLIWFLFICLTLWQASIAVGSWQQVAEKRKTT